MRKIKIIYRIIKKRFFNLKLTLADQYYRAILISKFYGIKIGSRVRIVDPHVDFGSEPFLVEIGNNVTISANPLFQLLR